MFFTKTKENLHAKHLEGAPAKGDPRQEPRSPPPKHTGSVSHAATSSSLSKFGE